MTICNVIFLIISWNETRSPTRFEAFISFSYVIYILVFLIVAARERRTCARGCRWWQAENVSVLYFVLNRATTLSLTWWVLPPPLTKVRKRLYSYASASYSHCSNV